MYCRHCSNKRVYKGITDVYPGGEAYLSYLMLKTATQYKLDLEFPFRYVAAYYDKPKHMHTKTWEKVLRRLQTLENMRFSVIMFKDIIDLKVIKYYLNEGLYDFTLDQLANKVIIWSYPARLMYKSDMQNFNGYIDKTH